MSLTSPSFLGLVGVGLLLFHLLPYLGWRRFIFLTVSLVFLASHAVGPANWRLPEPWIELIPLCGFGLLAYLCIWLVYFWRSRALFILSILVLLALFIWLKQYTFARFVRPLAMPYVMVGMSYILFRVLHVLIDVYEGALGVPPPPLSFCGYTCSFLTLNSGPIQLYPEFAEQEQRLHEARLTPEAAYEGVSRLVNGLLKVVLFSAAVDAARASVHGYAAAHAGNYRGAAAFGLAMLCYFLYLYLNFSGTMDIVLGLGRLFGFKLPENFNRPFAAQNFLDFWGRWHITLSNWLKLYVFNPLVTAGSRRFSSLRLLPYIGVAAYFITFLLMGVWHGSTFRFVIYGLFLGFGTSLNKLYDIVLRKRLSKQRLAKIRGNLPYAGLARALTLTYVAVALTCFWLESARAFFNKLGWLGLLESCALCILLLLVLQAIAVALAWIGRPLGRGLAPLGKVGVLRQAALAARAYLIVCLITDPTFHQTALVYMRF